MAELAWPYWQRIALCLVLILVAMGIQLSLPLGVQAIFDQVLTSAGKRYVHIVAGGLLVFFVLRSVLSFWGQFLLQRIGDTIVVDLRRRLFRHYHALGLGYHHKQKVGDLLSRLGSDVAALRNAISNLIVSFITNVFQLIGATVIMMLMNWKLGLMVLAVSPMVTVVSRSFGPLFRRLAASVQDQLASSTTIAQESLAGIEVTKTFGRGEYESGRYDVAMGRFLDAATSARRVDAAFNALVAFLASFSTIAIFWYGGLEVSDGRLSAGTLVAFLLYSQNVSNGIAGIAQHYSSFSQAAGASDRVFEIIDTPLGVTDGPEAFAFSGSTATVRFEGVWFHYRPGAPVLRNITLEAAPGQTVALVGASGAGKSTLVKLVSRLFDPCEGRIEINGRDLRHYTLQSVQDAVSVVSQDVFLFGTSVMENIRYGRLDASDSEVEQAAIAANAHEFIGKLPEGYHTPVGERGVQLSGGQRQRISIARALLKDAPILVLDEATSAVDTRSEGLIQEAIERLKMTRTTFVIAHRLDTLRNADQILVMAAGSIVARPDYEVLVGAGANSFRSLCRPMEA
ncbi:ABC transporter transmembrane domain-containing protein [Marilutibacter maris]|nr:ABC transporter ATP-binding protein [Lysobacter maris]